MKSTLFALVATTALALPAMAQTTIIGGAMNNGNLETGVATPFEGDAGAISTAQNRTPGGMYSIAVDLTANNGNGQWKGISSPGGTGVIGTTANDTDTISYGVWVYIPAATTFGPTANLIIQLEYSTDNAASWSGGVPGSWKSLNLTTQARDTWIFHDNTGINIPAGATNLRTRPWNLTTVVEVGAGIAADGGADGSGGVGPAVPADWQASGYDGFIYLDDFALETVAPPPAGTLICDNHNNGNFEAAVLSPFNPKDGAGSIDTVIVQEGSQSMEIDIGTTLTGNRWRGFNMAGTLPAVDGDIIGTSAWIYVPSTTTFGVDGMWFNAELRSDRNVSGNGNLAGQMRIDVDALPKDQWVNVTTLTEATDGDATISEINTTGWNVETMAAVDQAAAGYTGSVYFDDIKLMNLGPGPVSDGPGVMVGPNDNNGDMEGDFPAPWDGIAPWTVSGAGTGATTVDHTTGTGTSVCVDLTANNSNERWKGIHTTLPTLDVVGLGYDRVDVTTWVYIPAATTFGPTANFNMPLFDNFAFGANGGSLDLTTAARDTWVEVTTTGIDISGFATNLAINNWNIETQKLVGPAGMLVGSDGTDRTADATDPADLVGPATPADWQASGYDGVFYFDDVSVVAYAGAVSSPLEINDITRNNTTGEVTINYNSTFVDGADVYRSDDGLGSWTFDGAALGTGDNQLYMTTPGVPERLYILVEPFTVPADPTP